LFIPLFPHASSDRDKHYSHARSPGINHLPHPGDAGGGRNVTAARVGGRGGGRSPVGAGAWSKTSVNVKIQSLPGVLHNAPYFYIYMSVCVYIYIFFFLCKFYLRSRST